MAKESKPSADQITSWFTTLGKLYSLRNTEYTIMRRAFTGDYITDAQTESLGIASEFTDHKKLTYNMINSGIRRFMDEMTAPVILRAQPRGLDKFDLNLAERRSKAMMRLHVSEDMTVKIPQAAFYQGLLDKAIWYVRPNPDKPFKVEIGLVVPEAYFPVPKSDNWGDNRGVLISWRRYSLDDMKRINTMHWPDPTHDTKEDVTLPNDRVIEYWGEDWFVRVEDGKETHSIQHGVGAVLVEEALNIPQPHQHRQQGDADQVLGLNLYLNKLISDQADVLDYMANPIIVVRGTNMSSTALSWGPRSIWHLDRDASAEILTWAGAPPTFEAQILRAMQGVEDGLGISAPAFGREIPSGVSGETVRSILAGFNTRIGAKQTLMAKSLAGVYRKVQAIWEQLYPNDALPVAGEPVAAAAEGREDPGKGVSLYGRELKGWYDVQVIFQPQNEGIRTFSEIQKMDKGIQSKYRTMLNLGILNPEDELNRIHLEKMDEIQMQQAANAVMGGGFMGGAPPMGGFQGRAPFQPNQPANVARIPQLGQAIGGSDPGLNPDALGLGRAAGPFGEGEVSVRDIYDALEGVPVVGRVILVGDIVEEGQTEGKFEVLVEEAGDVARVKEALGGLAKRANVRVQSQTKPFEGPSMTVARPLRPGRRPGGAAA